MEAEDDGGSGAGPETLPLPPADGPVTVVWTDGYGALPVNGLLGHTKIPVCFIPYLLNKSERRIKQLMRFHKGIQLDELFAPVVLVNSKVKP